MQPFTIILGDKRYTAVKITAFQTRQANQIQLDTLDFAEKAKNIESAEDVVEASKELIAFKNDLATRKATLICNVFDNRFDIDELEESLSTQEIDVEVQRIMTGVAKVITKN